MIEIENRILILYSILKQNGKASKKQTLDYLHERNLIKLSDIDLTFLSTRKELKWRNELAYVRQHLVREDYLNNKETNYWEVTDSGREYFESLKQNSNLKFKRISEEAKALIFTDNDSLILESKQAAELIEDNLELKNETTTKQITLIKRYQTIVSTIKHKYYSKCQIKDCQYTFAKKDGEYYSEGHHLKPLSRGGLQDENNVVILCANHHRMFHFAKIEIYERIGNLRKIKINEEEKFIEYK